MANEIKVSVTLDVNDTTTGSARLFREYLKLANNLTGSKIMTGIQEIGTSAEAVDIGDIGTAGWFIYKNLGPTNFVEFQIGASGAPLAKAWPEEVGIFRLAANNPFAIADTAAVKIEYAIVEA